MSRGRPKRQSLPMLARLQMEYHKSNCQSSAVSRIEYLPLLGSQRLNWLMQDHWRRRRHKTRRRRLRLLPTWRRRRRRAPTAPSGCTRRAPRPRAESSGGGRRALVPTMLSNSSGDTGLGMQSSGGRRRPPWVMDPSSSAAPGRGLSWPKVAVASTSRRARVSHRRSPRKDPLYHVRRGRSLRCHPARPSGQAMTRRRRHQRRKPLAAATQATAPAAATLEPQGQTWHRTRSWPR
mmetsp:Transcript_109400/g.308690  ORF Transcript_109400/g.308690 Transcript_109400/m.308690 type:complete len:235 (-) Transcript_109400:1362-2066(-)